MTRKEFLKELLISVFGVTGVDTLRSDEKTARFYKIGASRYQDCTYTKYYGKIYSGFFHDILTSESTIIGDTERNTNTYPRDKMREKCIDFIKKNIFSEYDLDKGTLNISELSEKEVLKIYDNYILPPIFNIENKEDKDADFDSAIQKMKFEISKYLGIDIDPKKDEKQKPPLSAEAMELQKKFKKLFDEIKFDLYDERFVEDVQLSFELIKCKGVDFQTKDLKDILKAHDIAEQYNKALADFGDRENLDKKALSSLWETIVRILQCADFYLRNFQEDDFNKYKNTAYRIYREFYGTERRKIEPKLFPEWYQAHEYFITYILQINEIQEIKVQEKKQEKKESRCKK